MLIGTANERDLDFNQILQKLDQLLEIVQEQRVVSDALGASDTPASAFSFPDGGSDGSSHETGPERRSLRPALPDPKLVRRILKLRQARARHFGGALFADPAWDMLLDLAAARAEHQRVSVTSLCIASGVPATTALRWISQLVDEGFVIRSKDDMDARRAFISLSDSGAVAMARFFNEVCEDGGTVL